MTVFNRNRKYENGQKQVYPLFLGEPLSLKDGVDVTYPELEELIFTQRSQFWHEKTVDMSSDRVQFPTLPKITQDIAVLNLAWQSQADSVVGRAPIAALMPFVSNPELEELLNYWQLFEQIHSRAYQHIIKSVFPDPSRIRDEVANLKEAMDRLDVIVDEFEKLETLGALYTIAGNVSIKAAADIGGINLSDDDAEDMIYNQIIRAISGLYAMESIQFMASFACTFALANQKVLTGTSDQVRKIAKDEKLHVKFNQAILNILKHDQKTSGIYSDNLSQTKEVLDKTVDAEKKWAAYLFSEGRQIIGLNEALICEYIDYLATISYRKIGLKYDNELEVHPIPWVESYLNPEKVQVAPQERDNTNYTIGSVSNDFKSIKHEDGKVLGFEVNDFLLDENEEVCMGGPAEY